MDKKEEILIKESRIEAIKKYSLENLFEPLPEFKSRKMNYIKERLEGAGFSSYIGDRFVSLMIEMEYEIDSFIEFTKSDIKLIKEKEAEK